MRDPQPIKRDPIPTKRPDPEYTGPIFERKCKTCGRVFQTTDLGVKRCGVCAMQQRFAETK